MGVQDHLQLSELSPEFLCGAQGAMVEYEKLSRPERQFSIGPAFIIRELDLACTVEHVDHGTDLPAYQTMLRQVRKQRDNVKLARLDVHQVGIYVTKQLVSRGLLSPERTIQVLLTVAVPRGPVTIESIT